jgi:hypothetical protein
MDSRSINLVIVRETVALKKLLSLLEEQHDLLVNNDTFKLEEIIRRIELCNKDIAEAEVERRKLVHGESMKAILQELNDPEAESNYRIIKKVLNEVSVQRETNDILIKMGLGYSNRMLNIISPVRSGRTYNSYGKLKR